MKNQKDYLYLYMKENKQIEWIGKTLGRLTIISFNDPKIYNYKWKMKVYRVNCKCSCGNLHTTDFQALKKGKVISCGCYNKELISKRATKHGLSTINRKKSSEYVTWLSMKHRCNNINNKSYCHYGGRGITVCDEWNNNFPKFLEDMGEKPSKEHSIERIDVNKGYCKENCKWILKTEQPKNTRTTILFEYNGEKMGLPDWCKKLNLNYSMMRHRIYDLSMSFEDSIKIPKNKKIQKGKQEGELSSSAILTNENVLFIRKSELTRKELSIIFNVSRQTIDGIINRRTWKNI